MPTYNTSDFAPLPEVAIPGKPAYFFGSLPVDTQDTLMVLSSASLTTNVAAVTGTIVQGNIPVVGNFITVRGASNSVYNVNHAVITAVSGTASTGVYTISYAVTNANITLANISGMAIIPIAEVPEVCQNGTSVAIYVPSNELRDVGEKSITVACTFPSLPTAATVSLYAAINNNPQAGAAEWTQMGTAAATVAGGVQTVGPLNTFTVPAGRFFRLVVSGVSGGTSPTMICKMVC